MEKEAPSVRVRVQLPSQLRRELDSRAREEKREVSELIVRAVERELAGRHLTTRVVKAKGGSKLRKRTAAG